MRKRVETSVIYDSIYYLEDVSEDKGISKEEFKDLVEQRINDFIGEVETQTGVVPTEIDIQVCGYDEKVLLSDYIEYLKSVYNTVGDFAIPRSQLEISPITVQEVLSKGIKTNEKLN